MKKTLFAISFVVLGSSALVFLSSFSHIEGHVDGNPDGRSVKILFSNKGVTSSIITMNNTEMLAGKSEAVGFHLALIPSGDKYIPIAYDLVPFASHERAESYVTKFAKSEGLQELAMEQYAMETIRKAEAACTSDKSLTSVEKETILLVIRQTAQYMKTDYFAKIYMDGSRVRNPQEVLDWISDNTILQSETAMGELNKQPLQIKND